MTEPTAVSPATGPEEKLPLRDWLLLPLIALVTVMAILGGAEISSRRIFYLAGEGIRNCTVTDDAATGTRGVPNSVCHDKDLESRVIGYRFNSCGHRTAMQCGAPPDGAFRIVMTGSSFAAGSLVQANESFAGRLPAELSQRAGRKVELYDAGIFRNGFPSAVEAQMKDALAQHPDLILLVATPWDLENSAIPTADTHHAGSAPSLSAGLHALIARRTTGDLEQYFAFHSRLLFALRHTLYLSQSQYMRSYLAANQVSSFLQSNWPPEWRQYLSAYEAHFAHIESQAAESHTPIAIVFIPNRAEATMISNGQWPAGYDPYKLGEELRAMAARHNSAYIDILPDFRSVPNPAHYYMPVDGHLYPDGHALVAGMLARELTAGAVPQLRVLPSSSVAQPPASPQKIR